MLIYHATTTRKATDIVETGFRGNQVWDHANVVFFADRPLDSFGDMSGRSWIVLDADDALFATNQYDDDERASDEEQYGCRCYCFPVALVNQYARSEEQGLI